VVSKVEEDYDITWHLRTAPSPGGLFPIELYCISLQVDGLKKGLYFYDALAHTLEAIIEKDLTETLKKAVYLEDTVSKASACIVLKGVMPRVKFKYGERGYRFALLEAGHIAQNLLLAAQAEGLGSVPIGGFVDSEINNMLNVDGCEEAAVYLVLIGKIAK